MKIYELCLGASAVAFGVLLYVAADFSRWKHYALLRLTAQRWRDVLLTRMEPIHLGGDELIERWEAPTCNELVWRAGRMLPDAVGLIRIPRDAIGFLSEVDIQTKSRLLRTTGFVRVSGLRPLVLSLLSKSKRFEICLDKAADGGGICTKADTSQGHVSVALEARIAVHFELRIDSAGPADTVLETLFCREVTLLYELRSRLRDCLTQWAGRHVYAQAVLRPFDLVDELNKSWTSAFREEFPELIGWVSLTVSWVVLNPPETAEHARVKQIGERLVDLDLIEARLRQERTARADSAQQRLKSICLDLSAARNRLRNDIAAFLDDDARTRALRISECTQGDQLPGLFKGGLDRSANTIKQAEADCLLAYERLESFSAELEKERTAQLISNSGANPDFGQHPQTS